MQLRWYNEDAILRDAEVVLSLFCFFLIVKVGILLKVFEQKSHILFGFICTSILWRHTNGQVRLRLETAQSDFMRATPQIIKLP